MRDNIDIDLKLFPFGPGIEKLNEYTDWLKERNIKYSLIRNPLWLAYPNMINMRLDDALAFKLRFNL